MNSFRIPAASIASVLLLLATLEPASATKIGLNFVGGSTVNGTPAIMADTEVAGYASQQFWNNLLNSGGSSPSLQGDAGAGFAAFYANFSVSWSDTYGTRSTQVTDLGGNNRLMKGYLNTDNTAGGAATVTISGVPFTGSGYAVIVYFDGDNGTADRVTKITLSAAGFGTRTVYGLDKAGVNFNGTFKQVPTSSTTDQGSLTPDGNYVIFSALADSSFTLTVNGASASDGNSRGALNAIQIVELASLPTPLAPVITSPGTASGTVNVPFSYSITADNTPTSFTASGLPAGLSLSPLTGLISGTPTAAGTFSVLLGAQNAAGSATNALTLTISPGAGGPPVNDNFANRIQLSGLPVTATASNTNATKEIGEPNHAGNAGGSSLWWTWTATTNGPIAFTTLGSSFDTLLAVYTGSSISGLSLVASNDNYYADHTSMLVIPNATMGTVYQIAVDGYLGATGAVVLSITVPPNVSMTAPANNAVFSAPTNITLTANAFDSDGTIRRVYFYTNYTFLGSSATAPYSVVLPNPAPGTYAINAIAVDNLGGARQSSVITISVNTNGFVSDPLYTGVTDQLTKVSFLNSQVGYICGFNGTVLVTADGGVTWTRLNTGTTNNINAIQVVGPDIFIAGDNGLLSVSSDGGQSWIPFYVSTSVSLYTASLITPYYGFAAGANGTIYSFNGTSWTQQTTGTTVDFYGIVAIGSTGYAVGANGVIYRYNGTKWVAQSSGTTSVTFYDVAFYNASYGYVVGSGGSIRKTTNGGTNWVAQVSGVTNTLRKVYALDLNTAWCVGDGGLVLQTTNGGTAWTVILSGGSNFTGMDFTDGRGILVGPGGTAYDFVYQPVPLNLPPSVWLSSPYAGAVVNAGTTLNLAASASDASGISKVEFYQGSTLLGTATTIPYTLAWNPTVAGGYSLTALAYDNQGACAWSSPVNVTVNPAVDLGLSMTVSPATISITNTITVALVVTNRGPSTATSVQLKNIMPSDFNFSSATFSQGSFTQSGNTLWASLGSLNSGATATLTVSVAPGACGTLINYATVQANEVELNPVDNTAIMPISIAARRFAYSGSSITIRDTNSASVYPASIAVSGLTGVVGKVTVTLSNLSHTYTRDIDMLLVGPTGQSVLLMSDAGGTNSSVTNLTLTLDDSATNSLPNSAPLTSGVFRPANYYGNDGANDLFLSPAPAGPYGSNLSAFNGTNPNGTWSLYIMDDEGRDAGSLGGWGLSIATATSEVAPALTLTRSSSKDVLKWPAASSGFKVQTTVDLTWPVSWTNLTQSATVLNSQNVLTNVNSENLRFYRLRKP